MEYIQKLNKFKHLLKFEQEDAFENIIELRQVYLKRINHLLEIYASKKWRQDAYLIRTKIGPLLSETDSQIKQLVSLQQNKIENANNALSGVLATIIILSLIILATAIIVASRIAFKLINDIVTH